MTPREAEFTDFVSAGLASLRSLTTLQSRHWQRADDQVQAALIKLYVKWPKAIAVDNIDANARVIVVQYSGRRAYVGGRGTAMSDGREVFTIRVHTEPVGMRPQPGR